MRAELALAALLWAGAAQAMALDLPDGAERTAEDSARAAVALPVGPWHEGTLETRNATGTVTRTAWRISDDAEIASADLAATLGQQLEAAGYQIIYDCPASACGGYDFRFALETLPAPAMFVDLTEYHYLLAEASFGELLSVLVSRGGRDVYVQTTTVLLDAPPDLPEAVEAEATTPTAIPDGAGIWARLLRDGHAVLRDVRFETGSTALSSTDLPSLKELAARLKSDPGARIALVGHTDTDGGLDTNRAVSRKRAEAVRAALISDHGVAAAQIEADGVAYLAPLASNLIDAGRARNRRVEAVLVTAPGD
ncbi:OmpA family protein [Palleronia caenipelagi]|uniref:OmpA family protein n=1 Tax=Palleronia caenipelagi TaxID=2489174 RepID=A0A547Q6Q0_9RHOB|nr:OmpA family protein [Palleronia caenipelagi]TRD22066.1 OmpA family protein [Palleronia caenipelagi]